MRQVTFTKDVSDGIDGADRSPTVSLLPWFRGGKSTYLGVDHAWPRCGFVTVAASVSIVKAWTL